MIRVHVSNMSCGGCAKGVTRAILGVAPHAKVDVDLSDRVVTVNDASDEAAIVAAVQAAGYQASVLDAGAARASSGA